jgi:hypothetical protein
LNDILGNGRCNHWAARRIGIEQPMSTAALTGRIG